MFKLTSFRNRYNRGASCSLCADNDMPFLCNSSDTSTRRGGAINFLLVVRNLHEFIQQVGLSDIDTTEQSSLYVLNIESPALPPPPPPPPPPLSLSMSSLLSLSLSTRRRQSSLNRLGKQPTVPLSTSHAFAFIARFTTQSFGEIFEQSCFARFVSSIV